MSSLEREGIPIEVIRLAAEATSAHNDGWVQRGCTEKLVAIRDYIDRVLKLKEGKE